MARFELVDDWEKILDMSPKEQDAYLLGPIEERIEERKSAYLAKQRQASEKMMRVQAHVQQNQSEPRNQAMIGAPPRCNGRHGDTSIAQNILTEVEDEDNQANKKKKADTRQTEWYYESGYYNRKKYGDINPIHGQKVGSRLDSQSKNRDKANRRK
jgi:hypothetical protein